jgi:hypothetical protein
MPATEAWEMPPALEALAQALVASGKLRINADVTRNFVHYGTTNSDLTFTARELTDAALGTATRARVARLVAPALGEQGIADVWAHLRNELKKARGVSADREMKVARVLVQSAHPLVIQLLIQSGTEVFVSYAHNVGDLMAVHEWAGNGTASGLQATENSGTSVYVSAGGDPFFEGEHKTYTTDGFPALARMVVIAGQELGHFADLRRESQVITGRHSTDPNHSRLRASPAAREGRLSDMQTIEKLKKSYHSIGLERLCRVETAIAFYHHRLRYSPPWFFHQLRRLWIWALFIRRAKHSKLLTKFDLFPYTRLGDAISQYLDDMAFNLAPDADAYRNPDPLIEEAIMVIEAVARVPQQVHKWGHLAVNAAWPTLYSFYFGTIITACTASVKNPLNDINFSYLNRIVLCLRRRLRPRPAYYP